MKPEGRKLGISWLRPVVLAVLASIVSLMSPAIAAAGHISDADGFAYDALFDGGLSQDSGLRIGLARTADEVHAAAPAHPVDGLAYDQLSSLVAPRLGGLDDLAQRRAAVGAAPAGPGSPPTLSRLDVDGLDSFYGTSGHGRDVNLTVNPISRTHTEADVLQQLARSGGANGSRATLYIDHPGGTCGACGRSGAVRSMARQRGSAS